MATGRDAEESSAGRTALVGVLAFALGVMLTLMLRSGPPAPPAPVDAGSCPPVACAPPAPIDCAVDCAPKPRPRSTGRPAPHPPRHVAPAGAPESEPLPTAADDAEAHRDKLRAWFEAQAPGLADCVAPGAPRRKLLLEMHVEDDGRVARAALLGADDLPREAAACVKRRVEALTVPGDALRGRETVVVHVTL